MQRTGQVGCTGPNDSAQHPRQPSVPRSCHHPIKQLWLGVMLDYLLRGRGQFSRFLIPQQRLTGLQQHLLAPWWEGWVVLYITYTESSGNAVAPPEPKPSGPPP